MLAVERERRARRADLRLAAAVVLAGRFEVCEALLSGVPVPVRRLHPALADELDLDCSGVVVLDHALALRVVALGRSLSATTRKDAPDDRARARGVQLRRHEP